MAMTPEEQAEFDKRRQGHIGGTDVAAIVGVHPYKSAFDVWLEKTGQGEKFEGNAATDMGTGLEPFIAQKYERQKGVKLKKGEFLEHPEFPFMGGHLDYVREGEEHGVEIKLVGQRSLHRWSKDTGPGYKVPEEYFFQAVWYMVLTGFPKWDLTAQKEFARDLAVYTIDADPELQARLMEIVQKWWEDHIACGVPPAMGASENTEKWLAKKFPKNKDKEIVYTKEGYDILYALRDAEERKEAVDKEYDSLKNEVRRLIGDRYGIRGDFFTATWGKAADSKAPVTEWEKVLAVLGHSPDDEQVKNVIKAYTKEVVVRHGSRRLDVNFK